MDKNLRCSLLDPSIKDCHFNHSRFDDIPTTTVVSLYEDVISLEKQIRQLDLELKQQQQKALVEKEPSWTINVKDGKFQLATTIKTLEEFLLYGKSVIKYLSPFGNTFQTTHLEFKQTCPSLVKVAIQAASNFYQHQDGETAPQYALISYKPTRQPSDIYEKLIDNYFNCFNDAIPILHEPSYRTHLKNLIDPLEDPVTLAICTESSILTCKHSILDPTEKRYFGEFFYKRATHILTDIFDDPDRALESLLVISLLRMFLITTLRFEECKKWGAISVALCCSLHQEFGDFTNGGPHLPWGTRVKLALLHRNYAISQCYIDVSNFFNNSRTDTSRFFTQAKFGILPDESPKVQGILQMINHIHGLSLHPAFVLVVTQSKVKSIGGNARLYFEEIIRYEETVLEWWHKLPESFKICSDPLSLTSSIIDRTTDPKKLLMASYFYIFTLSTQALLVQPNYKENIDSLNQIIKERGVHFAMYSAKMSFQLAKRLEVLDVQCYCKYYKKKRKDVSF